MKNEIINFMRKSYLIKDKVLCIRVIIETPDNIFEGNLEIDDYLLREQVIKIKDYATNRYSGDLKLDESIIDIDFIKTLSYTNIELKEEK